MALEARDGCRPPLIAQGAMSTGLNVNLQATPVGFEYKILKFEPPTSSIAAGHRLPQRIASAPGLDPGSGGAQLADARHRADKTWDVGSDGPAWIGCHGGVMHMLCNLNLLRRGL